MWYLDASEQFRNDRSAKLVAEADAERLGRIARLGRRGRRHRTTPVEEGEPSLRHAGAHLDFLRLLGSR